MKPKCGDCALKFKECSECEGEHCDYCVSRWKACALCKKKACKECITEYPRSDHYICDSCSYSVDRAVDEYIQGSKRQKLAGDAGI